MAVDDHCPSCGQTMIDHRCSIILERPDSEQWRARLIHFLAGQCFVSVSPELRELDVGNSDVYGDSPYLALSAILCRSGAIALLLLRDPGSDEFSFLYSVLGTRVLTNDESVELERSFRPSWVVP